MQKLNTDVLIIGAGVAGSSLAVYLKRAKINFLVFEKSALGGKLNQIDKITNYIGINEISGPDLALNIFKQLQSLNIDVYNEEILDIKKEKDEFISTSFTYVVHSKIVVLATGVSMFDVKIKNFDKFYQKGISTCALCDGYLYREKRIVVVGENAIASKEYLYLKNISKDIIFINTNDEKVIEFIGDERLKKIRTDKRLIEADAAFVYLKESFNYSLVKNLNLEIKNNHLSVNDSYMTNIDKIYAIGDSIHKKIYQIIGAINDANIAFIEILKKLKNE